MGRCNGQCSRLTLSYDFAFLANIRMALNGTKPDFRRRRCIVHPIRRRMMMEPNDELHYAANASVILAYEKCRDDLADERGWRKFKARMRCFWLHGAYRRAKKRYGGLADAVRAHLSRLADKEKEKRPSVDETAAIFGDLLADIVSHGLDGSAARIARSIGWQTGRFIYIIDAIDDLAEDEKKGRFNPLLLLFGGTPSDAERESLHDALISSLADLETALNLIDDTAQPDRRGVLENILYLGMPATVRQVLYGKTECNKEDFSEQQSL